MQSGRENEPIFSVSPNPQPDFPSTILESNHFSFSLDIDDQSSPEIRPKTEYIIQTSRITIQRWHTLSESNMHDYLQKLYYTTNKSCQYFTLISIIYDTSYIIEILLKFTNIDIVNI